MFPPEIIAPKILVVFLAGFDDAIERFHAETLRIAQLAAQILVFNSAPEPPQTA